MSQVGMSMDSKGEARQKVLANERHIDTLSQFKGWQKNNVVETTIVEKIIAVAATPLAVFWTAICAAGAFGLMLALALIKALAWIWPKKTR